ncbi:DUF6152 family protein [Variovorax dokdonensis]|uniref:DUF6152 family protein n=1 Tax=Variovorax dokdonensis TaxID=344883 RepID=A0ABT7NCE4_9BURK|nr:DUF6152 family protein [Variovorax dokdonensis]MDM0045614.1 DUF6152 family protein [Variovorax dokdonensis]
MKRRALVLFSASAALPLLAPRAWAHHGWSGFDLSRPIYLEGRVTKSQWQNPHAELVIEVPADLKVPPALMQRSLPAQSANVDGPVIVAKAATPKRNDRQWTLELAPLSRMQAWNVKPIQEGEVISAVGYTSQGETGEAVMRVEYLFVADKTYGLRSNPA